MAGGEIQRKLANDYIRWLLWQKRGKLAAEGKAEPNDPFGRRVSNEAGHQSGRREEQKDFGSIDWAERSDCTLISIPKPYAGLVNGLRGESLRRLETATGTFCFFEKDMTTWPDIDQEAVRLVICSFSSDGRRKASDIVHGKLRTKNVDAYYDNRNNIHLGSGRSYRDRGRSPYRDRGRSQCARAGRRDRGQPRSRCRADSRDKTYPWDRERYLEMREADKLKPRRQRDDRDGER
eukprot:gnl/TRDRNA2_/TRDRNA2_163559_c0_seq2.p1 gnl/TRDRNA2_/TRDRNA2_163559_c0~~gnl/TRDRNA2_/TRDRNA2_163559_c0_seq2.p1  ORF type:complete len:271 (+),score=6.79 gnl/TRDRNA2_/TRDRNA2_163559_c0_seq2:111-815(+)